MESNALIVTQTGPIAFFQGLLSWVALFCLFMVFIGLPFYAACIGLYRRRRTRLVFQEGLRIKRWLQQYVRYTHLAMCVPDLDLNPLQMMQIESHKASYRMALVKTAIQHPGIMASMLYRITAYEPEQFMRDVHNDPDLLAYFHNHFETLKKEHNEAGSG